MKVCTFRAQSVMFKTFVQINRSHKFEIYFQKKTHFPTHVRDGFRFTILCKYHGPTVHKPKTINNYWSVRPVRMEDICLEICIKPFNLNRIITIYSLSLSLLTRGMRICFGRIRIRIRNKIRSSPSSQIQNPFKILSIFWDLNND